MIHSLELRALSSVISNRIRHSATIHAACAAPILLCDPTLGEGIGVYCHIDQIEVHCNGFPPDT